MGQALEVLGYPVWNLQVWSGGISSPWELVTNGNPGPHPELLNLAELMQLGPSSLYVCVCTDVKVTYHKVKGLFYLFNHLILAVLGFLAA